MPGLTILHALPRLLGHVDTWSGKNDKSGESWLLNHAKEMGFNTIWLSPFFKTSDVEVLRDQKPVSGSLYAMRDHFQLDDAFSTGNKQRDSAHLRHFTRQARDKDIKVMGDLVLNHVAIDHPEVLYENHLVEIVQRYNKHTSPLHKNGRLIGMSWTGANGKKEDAYFKFHRNPDFSLALTGANGEVWDDVARINYDSPAARSYFVTGENGKDGYWKRAIDWHIDQGFTGFRCDVAYMVPPDVWSELVQHAHDRKPGVVFMAETLGDNGQANHLKDAKIKVNGQERLAFDLAMLGTYWWNFKDDWLIHENERMKKIARFGGATFPDNHDTENTVARHFKDAFNNLASKKKRNRIVSDISLRNYAVAALISNSVYMQLGYEYCRKPVSVFHDSDTPRYWQRLVKRRAHNQHGLNLTNRIRAINEFRQKINEADAVIQFENIAPAHQPDTIKINCTLHHYKTGKKLGKMLVYINEKPENGPVKIAPPDVQDDDKKKRLSRLALGEKDSDESHFYEVNDVAAFYTPIAQAPGRNIGANNHNPNSANKAPDNSPDLAA